MWLWLWLWLVVLRGLGDRLAAGSPLLLLDVDVAHSIASVLSQPGCITLAGVHDAAAAAMAAVPTIAEIIWPSIGGQDQEESPPWVADEPEYEYMSYTASETLQLGGGCSSLSLGNDLMSDSFRCSLNDSPRGEPLDLDWLT